MDGLLFHWLWYKSSAFFFNLNALLLWILVIFHCYYIMYIYVLSGMKNFILIKFWWISAFLTIFSKFRCQQNILTDTEMVTFCVAMMTVPQSCECRIYCIPNWIFCCFELLHQILVNTLSCCMFTLTAF